MTSTASPNPQSPSSRPPTASTSAPRLTLPATTDPPSDTNPPTQKIWLVFGATGHIGRSLVKAALSHGDLVAAVGRTMENSMAQMQGWHDNCEGMLCDVRVRETVRACIDRCLQRFGRIDIIVNCTGYGVIGACEDQDPSDLRSQFETNFLGTLNIIQLSLPYFRQKSSASPGYDDESTPSTSGGTGGGGPSPSSGGRYLIFSSTSGALGVPGLGPYCATKYATEGLIESMLYEIDTFGIKATLVEPGHLRLDEPTGLDDKANNGSYHPSSSSDPNYPPPHHHHHPPPTTNSDPTPTNNSTHPPLRRYGHFFVKPPSHPYATPNAPAGHARRVVQWLADRQPTSAVKSAELVWQLGHCRFPPLRLLLGSFAVESVRDRLKSITEEIEDWKFLHFPVGGGGEGEGEKGGGGTGKGGEGGEEGEGMEGLLGEEEEGGGGLVGMGEDGEG
ncbi:NAD(P)-binding protein [Hortaea werneckii]|nr:NAD(P)-binding protein [Hortaea werneckii]